MHHRQIRRARQRVILELRVCRLPVPQIKILRHGKADALHHAAMHLALRSGRMYHRAAVDHCGYFIQFDHAGARIDFKFHALRGKVIRARFIAKAAVIRKLGWIVEVAHANDRLSARLVDVGAHDHRYRLVG